MFIHLKIVLTVALLLAASPLLSAETAVVTGVTGNGASYAIFVPDSWNGSVAYYAHGYRSPNWKIEVQGLGFQNALDFEVANTEFFRTPLLERGFAFALSTFSESGFAVKEGVQQTHQLSGLFKSHFGKPRRSYVVGQSLGGLMAVALAEKYPQHYDGALPFCGVVGGSSKAINEKFHLRAVVDYYYPGLMPGDAGHPPEGIGLFDYYLEIGPYVVGQIASDPVTAVEIAEIEQLDFCYGSFGELLENYFSRLFIHSVGGAAAISRTHEHPFFDNMETVYQGSDDDVALNAEIDRFAARPDALKYLEHHYEPSGFLQIPVLTLHNLCDPMAPISHEEKYQETVDAAGSGEWLVRRHVNRFGHCQFTAAELVNSFLDLVEWVEKDVKPSGGDVTQP
jgi:pimeloyl-ACP methyl ester carboxylesterase